jgi:hypothetical protein
MFLVKKLIKFKSSKNSKMPLVDSSKYVAVEIDANRQLIYVQADFPEN